MGIFSALIASLDRSNAQYSAPQSFKNYKETNGIISKAMTASILSVDYLDRLDTELRKNQLMIFRLGSDAGRSGTNFAVATSKVHFTDYFLDEKLLNENATHHNFEAQNEDALTAFKLLPKLTESSLVNLALASGVLEAALNLDETTTQKIPATCQSTFTFPVQPHHEMDAIWQHQNGQVEIDALFTGQRGGKKMLFIVESKTGNAHTTIAKHKLVYPYLAISEYLKKENKRNVDDIHLVPVYLKTIVEKNLIHFIITECSFQKDSLAISSLIPLATKHYSLRNFLI